MAINEACQVWIEQRLKEEIDSAERTGKSIRAISRELVEEIEKVFEQRLCLNTIRSRAHRIKGGSNEPPTETPTAPTVYAGDTGDKLEPAQVAKKVDALVAKGVSVREAATKVAEEAGKKPSAVRQAYCREKERTAYQGDATEAWQFAEIALLQLQRIRADDPKREEAFTYVINWINKQRSV